MFKYLVFACLLAFAVAKPGTLLSSPIVSTYSAPLTYSAAAPLAYSAPLSYSSYSAPLAYSGIPRPYAYGSYGSYFL